MAICSRYLRNLGPHSESHQPNRLPLSTLRAFYPKSNSTTTDADAFGLRCGKFVHTALRARRMPTQLHPRLMFSARIRPTFLLSGQRLKMAEFCRCARSETRPPFFCRHAEADARLAVQHNSSHRFGDELFRLPPADLACYTLRL